MTEPLSIVETLWTKNSIRCVFVTHLRPLVCAVQVFDGTSSIYSELVEDREEAINTAATLWAVFIDRTA